MMPKSSATMRPFGVDEEIALVHVGVKEAVVQGVAQKRLDEPAPERGRVEARAPASGSGSLSGVPSIHSIVSTSRVVRSQSIVGARNARVALEILAEFGRRRRLETEIHLHPHRARQRLDDLHRLQPARFRKQPFREPARRKTCR